MIRYSLRQLRYFVTTGETKSITKSSEILNVSQPSISTAILQLEEIFGVQLFIRHHAQGLSLTSAGQELLSRGKYLLTLAEDLEQYGVELGENVKGNVKLGCFFTFAPMIMPKLINTFYIKHANAIDIELSEGNQEELMASMREGKMEMALSYDMSLESAFEFEHLLDLTPKVLLPVTYGVKSGERVSLKSLIEKPFILPNFPKSAEYFLSCFDTVGIKPDIKFKCSSFDVIRGMVGNNLGYTLVTVVPENHTALDGSPFNVCPIEEPLPKIALGLVTYKDVKLTRAANEFREFCRENSKYWNAIDLC